jgi:ABC-type nitrate/sulfonate/bicarbonate transport system substrate-binding protein
MKRALAELFVAFFVLPVSLAYELERPVRIVYPGISIGAMVPALAIDKGFFQQQGLQVEFIVMPAATGLSALITPEIPVGDIVDFRLLREVRASTP